MDAHNTIVIRGARVHNLKNVDLDLPRNRLIVITGLSGSGKSSLAFDTLYAEGQRRYVESLSTYARQFLERMEKPAVDLIEGLSPAIAIEQKTASHNPRSTVGTVTEIYDYLRLLFARVGTAHCHRCGDPISPQSIDQIVDRILALPSGHRIIILAPLVDAEKGAHEKLIKRLRKDGFARVRIDGEILEIEAIGVLDKRKSHSIDVVVDRLVVTEKIHNRLADSLELALALSDGKVTVDMLGQGTIRFSEKATCLRCGIDYSEFTPASFSFNSPQGACPRCDGLGTTTEFDPGLIVPNPELSLREGAVAIWAHRSTMQFIEFLDALTAHYGVDIYTPYKDLPKHFKQVLMQGSGKDLIPFYFERGERRYTYKKPFEGIIPKLQRRYAETDSFQVREEIKLFMNFRPCSECGGAKLNRESRSVKVGGLAIHEISAMSIAQAQSFQSGLKLEGQRAMIAQRILKEIDSWRGYFSQPFLVFVGI